MATCSKRIFESGATLALLVLGLTLTACTTPAALTLSPHPVADNTWFIEGAAEEFSAENHGQISNSVFIVTGHGVILIDSGGSATVGEAIQRAIARTTRQPVRWVLHTHHHPDHVFGHSAFPDARFFMLPAASAALADFQAHYRRTLAERLAPTDLLQPPPPHQHITAGRHYFGGYALDLLAFSGHSGADLVVLDPGTGVLITGDMVFWQRAPATAHTPSLTDWRDDLTQLQALEFRILLPGHGPATDHRAIAANERWLTWLDQLFQHSAAAGLTLNEVLRTPLPPEFSAWPLARYELTRSASHFYALYEDRAFTP